MSSLSRDKAENGLWLYLEFIVKRLLCMLEIHMALHDSMICFAYPLFLTICLDIHDRC